MVTYLNDKTLMTYEVLWSWLNATALSNMIVADVNNYQPIIAHVNISSKGSWPYVLGSGHYMNYNGNSGTTIHVTDPYADRAGIPGGKYTIPNTEAERVTDQNYLVVLPAGAGHCHAARTFYCVN